MKSKTWMMNESVVRVYRVPRDKEMNQVTKWEAGKWDIACLRI